MGLEGPLTCAQIKSAFKIAPTHKTPFFLTRKQKSKFFRTLRFLRKRSFLFDFFSLFFPRDIVNVKYAGERMPQKRERKREREERERESLNVLCVPMELRAPSVV